MRFNSKDGQAKGMKALDPKGNAVQLNNKKNEVLFDNAMKAGKYYSRTGFASALDTQHVQERVSEHQQGLGSGSYSVKLVDDAGSELEGVPLRFGDRIFYPNQKNIYTIVDKDFLNVQLQKANEQEEYLNEVVELATASDQALMTCLGIRSRTDLLRLTGPANADADIPESIRPIDCTPSVMRLYNKESLIFAQAVAKIRAILMKFAPIIEGIGTNKSIADEMR
jgi:hypothetical protein